MIEPVRDNWIIALSVLVLLGALVVWWRSRR